MDFIKNIGIIGFLFFLIKGLLWILLFVLIYFKIIDKNKINSIKERFKIFKKNKK